MKWAFLLLSSIAVFNGSIVYFRDQLEEIPIDMVIGIIFLVGGVILHEIEERSGE